MKRLLTLVFALTSTFAYDAYSQWYHYADSKTHARGIAAFKKHIYLSSNTGLIYKHDIKRHTTTCMNLNNPLEELRDIDVNGKKVVAMQSSESSKLAYVINNKSIVIPVNRESVFYNGMVLYAQKGMMFGDQVKGNIPVYITKSGGIEWKKAPTPIKALQGEYGYSASGNNIVYVDRTFFFVTGGQYSRLISTRDMGKSWKSSIIPFDSGASSGAYSLSMRNKMNGVVVGGDYKKPKSKSPNCFTTNDGGKTWKSPQTPPEGYQSCVIVYKGIYYSCGPNGIYYSKDNGMNWKTLTKGKFYTMVAHKKKLFVSADQGRISKYDVVKN